MNTCHSAYMPAMLTSRTWSVTLPPLAWLPWTGVVASVDSDG
jgi:hypothetical protein